MSIKTKTVRRKILTISVLFMMFFTVFAVLPATEYDNVYGATKKGKVKVSALNVRSGPGTGYKTIGTLRKGETFKIKGTKKNKKGTKWYKLKYGSRNGYVKAKHVNIIKFTVKKVTGTKGTVKTKSGSLTVRKGPGTEYKKLGSLARGKTFKITGKVKYKGKWWYRLTYKKKTGYVAKAYVKTSKSSAGTSNDKSKPNASTGAETTYDAVTFQIGTTTASDGLNVRSGPGTNYSRLTILSKGTTVLIIGSETASNGKVWYKYQYTSSTIGYICSDYVTVQTVTSDSAFEAYLAEQGFPESYKTGLRVLHAVHPQWVFKAVNVGYNWSDALAKQSVVGKNLVSPSSPVSYRSTAAGAYNSSTKTWTKFDGSWYAANQTVIAYYMDPRNFLTDSGIYQFMTHTYDSGSQNTSTVSAVIKGSFMEGKNPSGSYSNYQSLIDAVGNSTGVNPNVLAAMIIQEQGWSGSSLVSGTYPGYKGYYNFFNVGAYATSTMNAVQRGLWYAKGSGTGAASYSRPWNSPYKSILGGAQFYSEGYVSQNQDSYYSKKFNVYNGLDSVATHQYMTNVAAAAGEGGIVKRAYDGNSDYPVIFEIPVYNNMPSDICRLP